MQKYEMVRNYIIKKIECGEFKKGQRLPSCRDISRKLSVNKITVNKAYQSMENDHILYSIPRGGFYVVESIENSTSKEKVYDFASVTPDAKLIPYREFSHVINKAVDYYKNSLFNYPPTGGLPTLRHTLKEMFEKNAVYTESHNIIITNGAQQGICLLLQMIFENSKGKLLVETPTYNLVLKIAQMNGINLAGIPRNSKGLDLNNLEEIFKTQNVKAFYIIPRHHNPTGFSLEEKQKRKIAELAAKYHVIVLEDDYLADLGSKKSCLPIHYYDTSNNTAYIRSFSKTFMPGIRLGAVVLPEYLTDRFTQLKLLTDLNTSRLPQSALDLFIKSGMYEKHVQKVKKCYDEKLKRAQEIIESLSPNWTKWHIASHGIFIWGEIENGRYDYELEKVLSENNILIKTTQDSYPVISGVSNSNLNDRKLKNSIRICISGISLEDMKYGLSEMMQVLNSKF